MKEKTGISSFLSSAAKYTFSSVYDYGGKFSEQEVDMCFFRDLVRYIFL